MGLELELSVLLVLLIVGSSQFAVFEVETPGWRKMLKWSILSGGTIGLYYVVGHLAVLFPVVGASAGAVFHFIWCAKHGIHPVYATPRRKYYDLRRWEWLE